MIERTAAPERAILVGLAEGRGRGRPERAAPAAAARIAAAPSSHSAAADLDELRLLARTAGAAVVGLLQLRRGRIHPANYLSKGKLEELGALAADRGADVIIFDDDLSPAQGRNLQRILARKVIDRTELILDIFARRARTREAQLQVELAQLQYLLPRLTRMWEHLSRLGGGIGTRGPGETQLEVDRRRVRQRISVLSERLHAVEREREIQSRQRRNMFRASLVGYTNAGKSTLFNALTRAGVYEEDLLFATLDTTTRRLHLNDGEGRARAILLSDTVGFIRKLPHHLVASFRATLREVRESDLLIHVVDAAQPRLHDQMAAVEEVVATLLAGRAAEWLLVLNKSDLLSADDAIVLRAQHPGAHLLSALDAGAVAEFRAALGKLALSRALPGDRQGA